MTKILVTGLALTASEDCRLCNYDFSWLFNYPSTLLWADKIIITPFIKSLIEEASWPPDGRELPKAIKMLFEILDDQHLIDVNDSENILTDSLRTKIYSQIEKDRKILSKEFPDVVKHGKDIPGQIKIGSYEYCYVSLASIYSALILSRIWGASCLFNPGDYTYLKYRFGLKSIPKQSRLSYFESLDFVFKLVLPNLRLIPHYAYGKECENCQHERKCQDNFLKDLEKNTITILKWRTYEEIEQLREAIKDIVIKYSSPDEIDPVEVAKELEIRAIRLNRLIKKVFPKVNRWSNMLTCVSIPLAIAGLSYKNSLLTATGAALASSSRAISELIKVMESQRKWVGFINQLHAREDSTAKLLSR